MGFVFLKIPEQHVSGVPPEMAPGQLCEPYLRCDKNGFKKAQQRGTFSRSSDEQ